MIYAAALSLALFAAEPSYLDKPTEAPRSVSVDPWVLALAAWAFATVVCLTVQAEARR